MIAAILTYAKDFSAKFFAGELNPVVTHWVLLGGTFVSELAVAFGIIFEAPKEKSLLEKTGMILVLGGVCLGMMFTVLLFLFDEGREGTVYNVAQAAARTAAAQGVQVVQQQSQIDQYSGQIAELERRIKYLETASNKAPAFETAPIPAPARSSALQRSIGDKELAAIRSVTQGAPTISIIPFMPGAVQRFADALAAAFESVPGAQVAVGRGNVIVNGQEGLIVQYDHSNLVSVSVFNALVKAGLRPTEGAPVSGSVVYIKVASL